MAASEGNPRVYIGGLSPRTRDKDIESKFGRYGRIRRIDVKAGFAFIEFDTPRDAEDAIRALNGCEMDGARLYVEPANGRSRARVPGEGNCFVCNRPGHWARDCPDNRGQYTYGSGAPAPYGGSGSYGGSSSYGYSDRGRDRDRESSHHHRHHSRSRSHSRDHHHRSYSRSRSRSPRRRTPSPRR